MLDPPVKDMLQKKSFRTIVSVFHCFNFQIASFNSVFNPFVGKAVASENEKKSHGFPFQLAPRGDVALSYCLPTRRFWTCHEGSIICISANRAKLIPSVTILKLCLSAGTEFGPLSASFIFSYHHNHFIIYQGVTNNFY